ncbi:MAG: AAA family ATPase [Pseudonocardiaceae bacterium]|nr:MAG: AAA family ATPase [Pseudonocardiaceae bacterium]
MAPLPKPIDHSLLNDNAPGAGTAAAPVSPFKRFVDGQFETASYLIKGILPLHGVALLAGQYSSGKTFVAMDIALSLICGVPFLGQRIKPGAVLWFAAEGAGIVEQRLVAARKAKFQQDVDAPFFPFLWEDAVPSGDTAVILSDLRVKIRAAKGECDEYHPNLPLRVVFIDTLAAFFALADENDNAQVATFMARLGEIAREMKVLIVPICHMGKNADGGIRGASAFGAGADGALAVLANINPSTGEVDGARTISLAKTRGGIPGPLTSFVIKQAVIGVDEDGDAIAPGYIEFAPLGTGGGGKQPPRALKDFIDSVSEVMVQHGQELQMYPDDPPRRVVRIDHVRDEFKRRHSVGETDNQAALRQAYKRGHDTALREQMFATREVAGVTYIWPVQV